MINKDTYKRITATGEKYDVYSTGLLGQDEIDELLKEYENESIDCV